MAVGPRILSGDAQVRGMRDDMQGAERRGSVPIVVVVFAARLVVVVEGVFGRWGPIQ